VNRAIVIEDKLRVFESPSVILEPLFFISDVLGSLDGLFLKKDLKMVEPMHRDIIFLLTKNNKIGNECSYFNDEMNRMTYFLRSNCIELLVCFIY
jgi:hypothetical protein